MRRPEARPSVFGSNFCSTSQSWPPRRGMTTLVWLMSVFGCGGEQRPMVRPIGSLSATTSADSCCGCSLNFYRHRGLPADWHKTLWRMNAPLLAMRRGVLRRCGMPRPGSLIPSAQVSTLSIAQPRPKPNRCLAPVAAIASNGTSVHKPEILPPVSVGKNSRFVAANHCRSP